MQPVRKIARLLSFGLLFLSASVSAQEIEARITINHQRVEQTSESVFESLKTAITEFVNNRQWTSMQFRRNEKIQCTFNITVNKYSDSDNKFDCTLYVQSTRPVFGATYTTTVFANQDNSFSFNFQEFDRLEFRPDLIDNELTALLAYYVYIIIGMDCDSMSPLGGTEAFITAQTIVNNAQSLSSKGWKAFDDSKNRYAIINDLLDNGMEPFRQLQYTYYREGLDIMVDNADHGRAAVTKSIELLKQARENKPLSMLPQLFTEFKADELVNIYRGKGTNTEKEGIIEILSSINASKNSEWNQMR